MIKESHPGHILRQKYNLKKYMYSSVHSSTVNNSQYVEATKTAINRGMDKEDVVHVYNGILFSH